MTISKKDLYFQYVRLVSSLGDYGYDFKITDVSVDVQNVVDGIKIPHIVWVNDDNHVAWDKMLESSKSCADMRLNDAGYNPVLLKHLDLIDNCPNSDIIFTITDYLKKGYVDLFFTDDGGILYNVTDEYYIIIDGDVTVDGKHTIVKSFRIKDKFIDIIDIYGDIHEMVGGDGDVFNVAKVV